MVFLCIAKSCYQNLHNSSGAFSIPPKLHCCSICVKTVFRPLAANYINWLMKILLCL